ncbi:hypothetical protein ECDEC12A_2553 [Escherichia coli DEC12A]|nr:hypothetical protein ECDEC12A_2553 [Escherichia coli DEC12A]
MRCSAVSVLDPLPFACCRLRCGPLLNERKKGRTVATFNLCACCGAFCGVW